MSLSSEFLGTEKYSLKESPMFKKLINAERRLHPNEVWVVRLH